MSEIVHAVPAVKVQDAEGARRPRSLAVETIAVAIGTLAVVRLLHVYPGGPIRRLAIPCLLVAAALLPAWIRKRGFPRIGLHGKPLVEALKAVLWVSVWVFPAVYAGLWLLRLSGVRAPLQPVLAGQQEWLSWLLYQFLYVAVSEEVFFRGYIQANVRRIGMVEGWKDGRMGQEGAGSATQYSIIPLFQYSNLEVFLSAGCFALAHVVVQGQIVSALTFLPGLLMAWLFVRTRSLLAPILFHGLANVCYGIMAATFA